MMKKTIAGQFIGAMSLLVTLPAIADVPAYGTVIEGQSVPGVALGSTREHVEAAYGTPTRCSNVEASGDAASCTWILEDNYGQGGQVQSQVSTRFRGPGGDNASNDPNDVVTSISWYGIDGWFTTAGINTFIAVNDPDAVFAVYPDGIETHSSLFNMTLTDYGNGISVSWNSPYLSSTTSVRMALFTPRDPPPPREPSVNVSGINLSNYKRQVIGEVRVLNDLNWKVYGALVYATWTLPNGTTQAVQGTTDGFGLVALVLNKARKGTYILTIDDVVVEDHPFDSDNSVLSASIVKKR